MNVRDLMVASRDKKSQLNLNALRAMGSHNGYKNWSRVSQVHAWSLFHLTGHFWTLTLSRVEGTSLKSTTSSTTPVSSCSGEGRIVW